MKLSNLLKEQNMNSVDKMKKLEAEDLERGHDFIYYDEKEKKFFVYDPDGDLIEIKNKVYLDDIKKKFKNLG